MPAGEHRAALGAATRDRMLSYIREHLQEHGYPPTVREIAVAVGLRSPSSVHEHLLRLQAEGELDWENGKNRTLTIGGRP